MPVARRVVGAGGKTAKESVQLFPVESAIVVEYKHPRWMPWTLTGVGAVIGAGGIALLVVGNHQMDTFTDAFIRECPSGCDLSMHPDLAKDQDSAMLKSKIGMGMLIGGGVTVAGAIVWGVTNRQR